ncbi:MAG: PolC-type DNA polymerase III [Firmicutes bacterium]|nr:PolC-type DNA polymerase III [Bacillota bacterium]
MENKLVEILTSIGLDKDKINLFNDANIKKIFINKESKTYKLIIESNDNIDTKITEEVIELMKNKFKNINDIKIEYYIKSNPLELETNENIIEKEDVKVSKEESQITKDNSSDNNILYGEVINGKISRIDNVDTEANNIIIEGKLFGIDLFESSKSDFKIITLKITDYTNSIYCKVFFNNSEEFSDMKSKLKEGNWYRLEGYTKNDNYAKSLVLNVKSIMNIESKDVVRIDDSDEKRVELHAHTFMSQMDGLISPSKLINRAKEWGHKAIAITDHNAVQAFPESYNNSKGIKVIYGVELNLIDDNVDMVFRESDNKLLESTYVVFDFETTGFNAGGTDSIIEVGAVKICNGEIIDRFDELINPGKPLLNKITELTGITDEMLKDKDNEENAIRRFVEWTGDLPMVAHNAKFDMSFLEAAYKKYNFGEFTNTVIDTLELSRVMDSNYNRHSLSALVKRYDIPFDEDNHHRADYDAEATALILHKMLKRLEDRNIEKISDIKTIVESDDIHKFGTLYHVNILVKNAVGLRNLFKLVSLANTKYLHKNPRILRSEIEKHREGLLIGSACANGEIFIQAKSKSDEELANLMSFYDYIEVQPISVYNHLIQTSDFSNTVELEENIKKIIRVARDKGKLVVATGDVHHLDPEDKIYREIIINQKTPGIGGFHPLYKPSVIKNIPSFHMMTTKEMLDSFYFIDAETRKEIVITNTNKIADMIEEVQIIKDKLYTPKMENSDSEVKSMVYTKAKEIYGDPLPQIIEERIEKELQGIIGGGFDVIYLIAQKLVKKSNDDGYIVGSRGSVGSSFVATMMGITEVNPLPAHYVCPNCKKSIFEENGISLGSKYFSGYDLPDRVCECGTNMKKEGQDMPFATFLGFNADKVPDIDLNFSGEYQWQAHDFTKVMFGEQNVFRAGTIGTVADRTAYGFVKGYCEYNNIEMSQAEIERLAKGCVGVKRTTGQHPGGIIVVPKYMDIYDFSPFQYPADDSNSRWYTTHFDFHAIHDNVLKLDILGHDDPTALRMLSDITGVKLEDIPFDDQNVLSIFSSPKILGVKPEQIMCETGTLGVPEFGTKFVIEMLKDTKPKTFAELVKISGLSHGTNVWLGNAKDLITNKICEFKDVIGCRDDIMVYLMYHGLEPIDAFKIMEFVRKGKASKEKEQWDIYAELMRQKGIDEWYIETCRKIKYMFPKAHATAYVMMGYRVAWFKIYYPIEYYSTYFSVRSSDYDIETMIEGYEAIKNKIFEINNKGYEATNKETSILGELEMALEMTARGFKFGPIDLNKSDSDKFIIDDDRKTLIPPFRTIDGLGDTVAKKIIEERNIRPFLSIEDLQVRAKISSTTIAKMKLMGILDNMDESNQLSLF